MPSLAIPQTGLSLDSRSKNGAPVATAVGLTLSDEYLESMIQCYKSGQPIQLALGERPSLHLGAKVHNLYTFDDPFSHEIYQTPTLTNPNKPSTTAAMWHILTRKGLTPVPFVPPRIRVEKISTPKLPSTLARDTMEADPALAQLQSSLASEHAKKQENTTKYIKHGTGLPGPNRRNVGSAKLSNKPKLLGKNNRSLVNTSRSMPSSPALSGVGSPSLGPTSAPVPEQQADKAKAARKPVVHVLAMKPQTEREILNLINEMSDDEIKAIIEKVGDLNESTGKYELRKVYWKELDVWDYDYDRAEDRQLAIDNAAKQYDKARMATSEPVWERLLPKEERGKGKCLSDLQARIANGQAQKAPKIKVHEAEGSGADTPGGANAKAATKVKGGEAMGRSTSNPPAAKLKKVSEKEAQAKGLLSKHLKPAPKSLPPKKSKAGNQALSSQFASDSDAEDNHVIPQKSTPKPEVPKGKRSREEEADTSDSSLPLGKRVKQDVPPHRTSDASQSSRTTNSSSHSLKSHKSKGTSPQKSSPLASSPPTNASDMGDSSARTSSFSSPARPIAHLKTARSPIHKRTHQKSASIGSSSASSTTSTRRLTDEVVEIAIKYKKCYPKYESLYQELADLLRRKLPVEDEKLEELREMQGRLEHMKRLIIAGIEEV